jgi:uncharacterized phage-associated protein
MEQTSILTHKNMEMMLNWLTGVENVRPEFAEPFMTTLHLLYMNKSETDGVRPSGRRSRLARPSPLSLKEICKETGQETRSQNSDAKEATAPGEAEAGQSAPQCDGKVTYGSIELAEAVADLYFLIRNGLDRQRPLTMSFLQASLYIIYGICLVNRQIRIIDEQPLMWRYGPVFARVYTKAQFVPDVYSGASERLRQRDPDLYSVMARTILACVDRGMRNVVELLTGEDSPWRRCRDVNPDKWSVPIDDGEIIQWFSKYMDVFT